MGQRSPLVLVVAVAACLLTVLGVQHFFFAGGMTMVTEGRLLRNTHDDYVHVAYKVNQLKKHPPQGQAVYIFGGSGAMEVVVGEQSFSVQVEARAGMPVSVVSLANHAQSMAQNLAIVDNLPRGKAMLLIGLAPMRFNSAPEEDVGLLASRSLLLRSPRLARLAPALYGRQASWMGGLPGAFDYISSYLRQRVRSGPFPGVRLRYDRHYYGFGATAASRRAKRRGLPFVYRYNRTRYAANHEYNTAVLRALLELARERGLEPVFFDQPLNTSAAGDWAGLLPRFRAEARRLAAEYRVPYLHVERDLTLRDVDFADLYHLMPPARARWQEKMARDVGELLRAQTNEAGSPSPAASPPP
jgi:hypothetical protein